MARQSGGAAILARVALVTVLLSACASPPGESGEPTASAETLQTTSTVPATPTTPSDHLTVRWEPLDELRELDYNYARVLHDGTRWLAYWCPYELRHQPCLTASVSTDSRTWTRYSIDSASSQPSDVAHGPSGWVISAFMDENRRDRLELWRSGDGASWTRAGEFQIEDCRDDLLGCPRPHGLALAPSGAIVIGSVEPIRGLGSGPYVSTDGVDWTFIGTDGLGVEAFNFSSIQPTSMGLVLAGPLCAGCDLRTWSTTDGFTWDDLGELASEETPRYASFGSVATIGDLVLAEVGAEDGTEMWSREAGGPWTRRVSLADIYIHKLAVVDAGAAGPAFLAVGRDNWHRLVQLISVDGIDWIDVPAVDLTTEWYDDGDCSPSYTVAGGTIVMIGAACGVWRGTLELQPGPPPTPTPTEEPEPEPTVWHASLPPGARFDATIAITKACLEEPGRAQVKFEISFSGDVAIRGYEADGGSIGFPPTTSHSGGMGRQVWAGTPQVLTVTFHGAVTPVAYPGPIVHVEEFPFTVDPENHCSGWD